MTTSATQHRSRPAFPKGDANGFYRRLRGEIQPVVARRMARARALTWLQAVLFPGALAAIWGLLLWKGNDFIWFYACYAAFGVVVPLVVLAIVHPAVHMALFDSARANRIMAHILDLVGSSSFIWGRRHVQFHHTYTNIPGWDVDVDGRTVIRLAPTDPLRRAHRYQHLYLPLLYPIYTLNWFLFRDFRDAFSKDSIIGRNVRMPRIETFKLVFFKLFYLGYIVAVPAIVLMHPWHVFLLGFLLNHACSGVLTLLIVLPTHFDEHAPFPVPDAEASMPEQWAVHQIRTTNDYSTGRPLFTFLLGGLNHHVAHHLFPAVNHNALPALTELVEAAAREERLPYKSFTYVHALRSHFRLLKRNGMTITDILEE